MLKAPFRSDMIPDVALTVLGNILAGRTSMMLRRWRSESERNPDASRIEQNARFVL